MPGLFSALGPVRADVLSITRLVEDRIVRL
jgi:hypothetical protein